MESALKRQKIAHPFAIDIVVALWMTAAMFAQRLLFGISSVPGLITERSVPIVPGNISGIVLGALGQFSRMRRSRGRN